MNDFDSSMLAYLRNSNKRSRFYYLNGLDIDLPKYVSNKLKARYNKVSRIREHFIYILNRRKYVYFLTFTFNEKYISKCDRTQKDLIKNCLNNIDDSLYILNVDYGKTTNRKHFHCILGTDWRFNDTIYDKSSNTYYNDLFFEVNYPCYCYIERIYFEDNSIKKVSKYLNKLSNHATKDSTCYSRVYYNFKGFDIYNSDKPLKKVVRMISKNYVGLT